MTHNIVFERRVATLFIDQPHRAAELADYIEKMTIYEVDNFIYHRKLGQASLLINLKVNRLSEKDKENITDYLNKLIRAYVEGKDPIDVFCPKK
ncbi:MAG: hypothetical protein LBN27_12215 [Prevotellaceae bacterium]|jgi:hypothetical protein|nr:hypothetical protein [Prevotellaceae bacterium]